MKKRRMVIVVATLAAAVLACSGNKKTNTEPEKAKVTEPCETNADCEGNLVCLASACTDTSSRAIYTNPAGAVTPDKVKRHVEDVGKKAQEHRDKALDIE